MYSKPCFSVIGCGRVGTALAVFLTRAGYRPAAFYSRSEPSAKRALAETGEGRIAGSAAEAARLGQVVFISTPDLVIESVCEAIAGENGFSGSSTVYHLSGALSSDILSPARQEAAHTGSIHPLQSFAPFRPGQSSPFSGINISVEGDEAAVRQGRQIVKDLGASCVCIPTRAKTLYHAAAVVASNYLVTLEDMAVAMLKQADLTDREAFAILEPLIRGTVNNIRDQGTVNALTGPVARGDAGIVREHLRDIDRITPQFSVLYRNLGRHTLELAKKRGALSPTIIQDLEDLFTDS